MSDLGEHRFVGVLYELPSNYSHIMNVAVDVPERVSDAFGLRGHVPVVGAADGDNLVATLVPVGSGRHRLFLNGAVRDAIGKGVGDPVEIRIRLNRSDRTLETPADLAGGSGRRGRGGGLGSTHAVEAQGVPRVAGRRETAEHARQSH